jgi:uncharacterized protein (DUF2147 family)
MKAVLLCAVALIVGLAGLSADPAAQCVGFWKSISDVKGEEGKVTALWRLSVDAKGQLQGVIVWVPGKPADEKYVSNKAEFNGLAVRGTVWMKGLKNAGNEGWKGGTIVDVGNAKGDVYGCDVKAIDNGKKLAMRGYVGIALIGRTQTWELATEDETKTLMAN